MPALTLKQIFFQDFLRSKKFQENYSDIENFLNNLQSQVDGLATPPAGSEVTNARDFHAVLRDRIRSGGQVIQNVVITGGVVSEQPSPNLTVQVSAGEAIINGVGCKWAAQNSGTIAVPTNNRFDIVVANSDNTITVISGNDSVDPVLPVVAITQRPLAIITLTSATTDISDLEIMNIPNQGCRTGGGKWFFLIQDAVDDLDSVLGGDVQVGPGHYYEEIDLTGKNNIRIYFAAGAVINRIDNSTGCLKSINSFGSESEKIFISGGDFRGNGKAGIKPLIDLDYCKDLRIQGSHFDENDQSGIESKGVIIKNSETIVIESKNTFSREISGSKRVVINGDDFNSYSSFVQTGNGLSLSVTDFSGLAGMSENRVALFDGTNEQMRMYDFNGTNWAIVGSGLFIDTNGDVSLTALKWNRVAFVYKDPTSFTRLATYDFNGSTWSIVGNTLQVFPTANGDRARICALSDTRVVIFDSGFNDVRVFDFNGTDWSLTATSSTVGAPINGSITALSSKRFTFFWYDGGSINRFETWEYDTGFVELDDAFVPSPAGNNSSICALSNRRVAFCNDADKKLGVYQWNPGINTWERYKTDIVISSITRPEIAGLSEDRIALLDATVGELRVYDLKINYISPPSHFM